MPPYRFLEHTADAKFQAFGISLRDLFRNSALAMCSLMYDAKKVEAKQSVPMEIKAGSIEELLHRFLEEVLAQIDIREMFFRDFNVFVDEKKFSLKGTMVGEKINAEKHTLKTQVKAVSWHQFFVEKKGNSWQSQVIVDI
jgi:SHS2 domain-containing protein